MKTAISLSDELFDRATARAAALGMSRSEFFAKAAAEYLDALDTESLTARIDTALDVDAGTDGSTDDAVAAAHRFLTDLGDDW